MWQFRENRKFQNRSKSYDSGAVIVPLSLCYRTAPVPLPLPLSFASQESLQAPCFGRVAMIRPAARKALFLAPGGPATHFTENRRFLDPCL